jgi:hypothetical protein
MSEMVISTERTKWRTASTPERTAYDNPTDSRFAVV